MEFQKILSNLAEKKIDILVLGLTFLFFLLCIILIILILIGRPDIEQLWMVFGTITMILLILSAEKSFIVIFIIIIIGTFVVDEDFLLEVASVTTGESLSTIRESRKFNTLPASSEKAEDQALTLKLKELLKSEDDPGLIIKNLKAYQIGLEIKEDLPGLSLLDKDVIFIFAAKGALEDSAFYKILENKGYDVNGIADSFEKLGAADYVFNDPKNKDVAALTEKGITLANNLGIKAVKQIHQ